MLLKSKHSTAYRLGAYSCLALLLYSLATILIVFLIGGPPSSVDECFAMLKENRVLGLLRLDILTVFVMPLYFIVFYALYLSLREIQPDYSALSFIFILVGVSLFLAAPSVFSFLHLSDRYHAASEDKPIYKAAAEALFATDIWNGTGPKIGGLLVQIAATAMSVIMLKSVFFGRFTAITGIITHGLDLIHIIIAFFLPVLANGIMAVAGILYLLWFPLVMRDLLKMARLNSSVTIA